MACIKRWRCAKSWNPQRHVVYLDVGANSVVNNIRDAGLKERACLVQVLKMLVESSISDSLASNHFGTERDGIQVMKCDLVRCYWFRHPSFEANVCLLHLVVSGKSRQQSDIEEAISRKRIAEGIQEITESE